MQARLAVVRGIGESFARAVREQEPAEAIDVARARVHHAAYVEALREAGLEVVELPALEEHPDGCFVEDCAVLAGGVALGTRPGHPSRRGEVDSVARALGRWVRVVRMEAPATLDGGDCLRVGRRLFVGRSSRTSEAGAACLRATFAPLGVEVHEVPVAGMLHLKCACSALDEERILLAEDALPASAFPGVRVVPVPSGEAYAANCVVANGVALVAAGHEATARQLEREGLRVVPVPTSETRKADGALTCQSILIP